jgi:hypothetical protein
MEKCHDHGGTWYTGGLGFEVKVPRTSLGVVSWDGSSHIRVYYGTADGRVKEKCWDGKGWYDGGFNQASVPGSRVDAISIKGSDLRTYIQNGAYVSGFTEFAFGSSGWVQGASPLPTA